nr:phage integrase N-terminal SAM-like domain-containing protein [Anaerolineae bacterium]
MSDFKQLPMFNNMPVPPPDESAEAEGESPVKPETPLQEAVDVYLVALKLSGASIHTLKAFKSDLNLLGSWSGEDKPVGDFSTAELNKFLHWMLTERGKPCSPKTYARRVTTLKNFFSYLYEERAVQKDPAVALIQKPVSSPLPDILFQGEVDEVRRTIRGLRTDSEKPDARPELLVSLLLQTGIKKSECVGLRITDVVRDDLEKPYIWVRYANPRMRFKERKIVVEPALLQVLDEYLEQRKPTTHIFECTPRNLEYVLRDVTQVAGLSRLKLSFELLRWTASVQDYMAGMEHEKLRQKMGLSRIAWRDTSSKLEQLAQTVKEHEAQKAGAS